MGRLLQVKQRKALQRNNIQSVSAAVAAWHRAEAKAYKEKLEREATQRMALLKQKDFNAYLDAVQQHSSKHVEQLLDDTNSCLRNIMSRLKLAPGSSTGAAYDLAGCACLQWLTAGCSSAHRSEHSQIGMSQVGQFPASPTIKHS